MDFVFIADGTPRYTPSFTGSLLWGRGLGGTEASIVVAAEALVAAGCNVTVIPPGNASETFNGVRYRAAETADGQRFDVAILFKSYSATVDRVVARRRVFWPTDAIPGIAGYARAFEWSDSIVYVSAFQQAFVTASYEVPTRPAHVIPWAIRTNDYDHVDQRRANQLLYCSVPDRGLRYLAELFPRICAAVPDVTLTITSDFTLWGREHGTLNYRRLFDGLPGIDYRGCVSRKDLIALQQSSKVLAYPCTFPEAFCVAVAECMAAGSVPITTDKGALQTTVNGGGVLLAGEPSTEPFASQFVQHITTLLLDDDAFRRASLRARKSAKSRFNSDAFALAVLALVT